MRFVDPIGCEGKSLQLPAQSEFNRCSALPTQIRIKQFWLFRGISRTYIWVLFSDPIERERKSLQLPAQRNWSRLMDVWKGAENDVRNRRSDEMRWLVGGLQWITTGSKETSTRKNVATHNVGLNNGRSKVGFRDCSWYEGTTICRPWGAAVWLQEERSWGKSSIAAGGLLPGGGRGTDLEISDVTRPKGLELGREVAFSTGSRVGATVNQGRKRGQDTGRTLGPHGEKLTGLTGHCLGPTST